MTPSSTYELLSTGWLPGWLGLAGLVLLGAFVCRQLQCELQRLKGMSGVAYVIMGVRVAILGLGLWLICQPLLLVTTRWQVMSEQLLLMSKRSSMNVREEFGALHEKIDVLEVLEEKQAKNRNRAASGLVRNLSSLETILKDGIKRLEKEIENQASGLPHGQGFKRNLLGLAKNVGELREYLVKLQNLFPAVGDEKLKVEKASVENLLAVLTSGCQKLSKEADLVRKEAASHPDLLDKFIIALKETHDSIAGVVTACRKLQTNLDEALVSAQSLKDYRSRSLSRQNLSELASKFIIKNTQNKAETRSANFSDIETGLKNAIARQLTTSLSSIIILDDGSTDLKISEEELLETLSDTKVPVHTVLVGADGIEPKDVGVMSAELPGIAIVGKRHLGRAMVKARTEKDGQPRLIVREGQTVLAEKPVAVEGESIVEFALRFDSAGRKQIVIEMETDGIDVFQGNERYVTVIDVFKDRPKVFMISDSLSGDFALFRGVASALPYVRVETIMADDRISKIKVGTDSGEFPEKEEQWNDFALLVLIGGVPVGLPEDALASLRTAIEKGLHVFIQAGSGGGKSWPESLGLNERSMETSPPLMPQPNLWLPLYQLGRDETESLERWRQLPEAEAVRSLSAEGISLTAGEQNSPIKLIQHGQGFILYCGLPSMASLRSGGSFSINRIVAGLLELGIRPLKTNANGHAIFPPQPVFGKQLFTVAIENESKPVSGLEMQKDSAGLLVKDKNEVVIEFEGESRRVQVHKLLGQSDFRLTPRAEPLREIAKLGNGRFVELIDLPELIKDLKAPSAQRSKVETYRLWVGWWPFVLILALASSEYLLRRKAGRVM